MMRTIISREGIRWIIGLLIGAAAAVFLYPRFLTYFVKIERPVDAEISFSRGMPAVNVAWDDLKVFADSSQDIPAPGKSLPSRKWHIVISSTGEHHRDSRSSEVWVFGIETPERVADPKDVMTGGASPWTISEDPRARNHKLYAAAFGGPKSLETTISGSRLKLRLLKHSFSGRVRITVNGNTQEVDLYAPTDGVVVDWEYPASSAPPGELVSGTLSFSVRSGQTYTDELRFSPVGGGGLTVLSASSGGRPLERLGPNRFSSPATGRMAHRYAAVWSLLLFLVVSFVVSSALRFFPSLSGVEILPSRGGIPAVVKAVILSVGLCLWNLFFQSQTVAFVNVLPSLLAYWAVVAVGARISPTACLLLVGSWVALSLRLPLLGGSVFGVLHGLSLVVFLCCVLVLLLSTAVDLFERRVLYAGFFLIVCVALSHLGILSPYTYAAIRPIWPDQYITPIGGILTNGDLPHFTDLFYAYTSPTYHAGFSVVLRRFFYEYLWSTAWPIRPNWVVGIMINVSFWFAAIVALLNVGRDLVRTRRGAVVVVLGGALSLGFATVVGQPVVYMAAYAWTSILLWVAVSLLKGQRLREFELPLAFVGPAIATYDMLPITAAFILGLLIQRRFLVAALWGCIQIAVPVCWSNIVLAKVLQTFGNPSNTDFLNNSLGAWKGAILSGDVQLALTFVLRGVMNAVYAGFGVGLAVVPLLFLGIRRDSTKRWICPSGAVVIFCGLLTLAYLASGCLIAPELPRWSPGWQIPRYSYYYYPATLCAFGLVADRSPRWVAPGILMVLGLLGFADTLGQHNPAMLLHYGNWYGIFTKW